MKYFSILILCLFTWIPTYSQDDQIDIFVIDAYVTPEIPHTLKLTFFTGEPVKSDLVLNDKYEFMVSKEYLEDHTFELKLSDYDFDSSSVPYYIKVTSKEGINFTSEVYDLSLPSSYEIAGREGSSLWTVCCFGGVVFGMPSPAVAVFDDQSYFSLSKTIPVVSIFSGGYNYPVGIVSLEYSHIFDGPKKNFLRLGYNQVIELDALEYFSPGASGFTDFLGYNGVSAEASIGWFKVYNVFTVYTKYRYNFGISNSEMNYQEISLGLYSSFFSISF